MNSGKRLLAETTLAPLIMWIGFWVLFYIRPPHDVQRDNFNISWLIVTVVSFFITLAIVALFVKRLLRKAGYPPFKLRELSRVLEEIDPKIIRDSQREIFNIVAFWGVFSSIILRYGPEQGVVFAIEYALLFVVVVVPMIFSIAVPVVEVPFVLYEIFTGKQTFFVGKQTSDSFKWWLRVSLVPMSILTFVGLMSIYMSSWASNVVILRPLLNIYSDSEVYRGLLLLS